MSSLRIEQRVGVRAPAERIWDVITDLPRWDGWNPVERAVEGRIGFRTPISLTEALPHLPERRVTAVIGEWQPESQLVWIEKRGWMFNVIRYYEIETLAPGSCIVSTGALYSGLRGEGFHDKHRKAIKAAYAEVVEALRRQVTD